MATSRVLIVDSDDLSRTRLQQALQAAGFDVAGASSACQALREIASEDFEILLAGLTVPPAEASLSVIRAMRRHHPLSLIFAFVEHPWLPQAGAWPDSQADEILAKPVAIAELKKLIRRTLASRKAVQQAKAESLASILERELERAVNHWMDLAEQDAELAGAALGHERCPDGPPRLRQNLVLWPRWTPESTGARRVAAPWRDEGVPMAGSMAHRLRDKTAISRRERFRRLRQNSRTTGPASLLPGMAAVSDGVTVRLRQSMLGYDRAAPKPKPSQYVRPPIWQNWPSDKS